MVDNSVEEDLITDIAVEEDLINDIAAEEDLINDNAAEEDSTSGTNKIDSNIRGKGKARLIANWRTSIQKLRKKLNPQVQLPAKTLSIMDSIVADNVKHLLQELKTLCRHKQRKTLNVAVIEHAAKLILPALMQHRATEFARAAVVSAKCKKRMI